MRKRRRITLGNSPNVAFKERLVFSQLKCAEFKSEFSFFSTSYRFHAILDFYQKIKKSSILSQVIETISVEDTSNLFKQTLNEIRFYIFFVRTIFWIKLTVYEIMRFFEFLEKSFLNRNSALMVEDTLNLMTHFRKKMKFGIFFIRDIFLI